LAHLRAVALEQCRGLVGDAEELLLGAQALVLLFFLGEVALRLAQLALDLALLLLGLRGVALLQGLLCLLRLRAGLRQIGLAARVLALLDAAREVEDRLAHLGLFGGELLGLRAILRIGELDPVARRAGGLLEGLERLALLAGGGRALPFAER